MKRIVKSMCVLMCVLLILSSFIVVHADDSIIMDSEATLTDKKVYANATIDQDFADNRVLVVLDGSISSINKIQGKSLFGSVDGIKALNDLTYMKNYQAQSDIKSQDTKMSQNSNTVDVPLVNTEAFRQVISLELTTNSKKAVLQTIKELEQIDGIVYAGPDYRIFPTSVTESPNDSYFSELWAFDKIQVTDAWSITKGSSDVRVGVIDSGIAAHPDLTANVVAGWDFVKENSITTDDGTGHGTHIAGIIAAECNNEIGVAGIAPNVKVVPLQIADEDGLSQTSDVIEAVTYAINNNIPILNYSYGSYIYNHALKQAISNYSGLFVCAAGNDNSNVDRTPDYVTSYGLINVISVASTKSSDELRGDSNYGPTTVHIAAPGDRILNCFPEEICSNAVHGGGSHYRVGYHHMVGTSMATPHVAGVAALMKSINPDLTSVQIKAILMNTVDINESLIDKCVSGGRLNAYKAVNVAYDLSTANPSNESIVAAELFFNANNKTITGCNDAHEEIAVPATINGVPVETIGTRSLVGTKILEKVDLSTATNLKNIRSQAFLASISLERVIMPDASDMEIGPYVFAGCTKLVVFVKSETDAHLYMEQELSRGSSYCVVSGNSILSYYKGYYGSNITVDIPSSLYGCSITAIGGHAFDAVDNVEIINIPETVTTISYRAFRNCSALRTLCIPSSVTSISNSMNSTIVEGSPNVTIYCMGNSYARGYAMSSSVSYVEMTAENGGANVEKLHEIAGRGTEYVIPKKIGSVPVNMISVSAFANTGVTSVVIPESVTDIGYNSFSGCTALADVYFYNADTEISIPIFDTGISAQLTFYGPANSTAEAYARLYGLNFVYIT